MTAWRTFWTGLAETRLEAGAKPHNVARAGPATQPKMLPYNYMAMAGWMACAPLDWIFPRNVAYVGDVFTDRGSVRLCFQDLAAASAASFSRKKRPGYEPFSGEPPCVDGLL
jgi:hypothetical protein